MNTWIFQGNPTKFNVNDYLLENAKIWWSIRQKHFVDRIKVDDEVFIWRSDGEQRGSGGIIARTKVVATPQEYVNDEESANYWYEELGEEPYLAVQLQVLEIDVVNGLNRLELAEHPKLKNLMIMRLKQNTNYIVEDELKSYLRQLWYSRYEPFQNDISTRFREVTKIEHVIENMKQFQHDLGEIEALQNQLKSFQQWYYIADGDLLAPSKFIGYQEMKGDMYVDKQAIAELDGRITEKVLKEWFVSIENEKLSKHVQYKLNGKTRKDFAVNILKTEIELIEHRFTTQETNDTDKQLINELHRAMLKIYDESKAIGYTPSKFRQMVANEGGLQTAKKLIGSKQLSDGFAELAQLGRLDLTVEALVLQNKYRPLFSNEELAIARNRLEQLEYEIKNVSNDDYQLPSLDSNGRVREYNYYSDELKAKVLYEHLINSQTHRWMDINILGRTGNTNGRDSANILYYLGIRADYRGAFKNKSVYDVIGILQSKGVEYAEIVRLLKVYSKSKELYEIVKLDIEAQQIEEGNGIEGTKKKYLVNKYERDPKNRKKAIEIHGLKCRACKFNFQEVYGERGIDFIEIHHIKPLSELEEAKEINPKTDLVPLCANCHRMVHRRIDDVLSVEELIELIEKNKN
ncbi:EVE domain-containing protein [Lysinibacillus boronitolerans]|uniref:EVE domain-containing protein n=1 Tax=Lysinibacillus boronitolerans TaxID=309788 RepID=UPI00385487B9